MKEPYASDFSGTFDGAGHKITLSISGTANVGLFSKVGEDGTVSLKNVSVEEYGDNTVRVDGLSDGDIVVTAGVHKLHEGQSVRVGDSEAGL